MDGRVTDTALSRQQTSAVPVPEARMRDLAAHGHTTISKGSKSFALASFFFDRVTRADVQMLYAWCRHCDDVIDGQDLGGDAPDITLSADEQARRLAGLRRDTLAALEGRAVGHPAFDGFSLVAQRHQIPTVYPMDLLEGFAKDVARNRYETLDDTLSYCYGVAGAVGIMMAIVMGADPENEALLDRACDLGLAFQLTNIARDIVDDAKAGRIYLPTEFLEDAGLAADPTVILNPDNRFALAHAVSRLLQEADLYYASATEGIPDLRPRAAAAIASARNIYRDIGRLIRNRGPRAWDDRAHTSKPRKLWLAARGCAYAIPRAAVPSGRNAPARNGLWSRPRRELAC